MISFSAHALFPTIVRDIPCVKASPHRRTPFLPSQLQSASSRRRRIAASLIGLCSSTDDALTSTWSVKRVESDEELLDFLQLVLQGYFEDDHSRYVQTFMRQRLESEIQRLKVKYQSNGDKHPESLCLIAVADTVVVGGCEVCVSEQMSGICPIGVPVSDKNGFYIQNLITAPDHRRQGIGNAVMQEMLTVIKEMDASTVYAHVEAHNDGAVEFYKRLGFEVIEEEAKVDPSANLGRVRLLKKDLVDTQKDDGV